jgi:dihydropteroate synthase
MMLKHARGHLPLNRCLVMGIVNRTPDSFFDGGRMDLAASVDHALGLVDDGADILDVGAVKAGPGAEVPLEEEMERLIPLVGRLAVVTDIPLSIETARHEVARAALAAGAALVNDVSGLSDPGLPEVCAEAGAAVVLMHHGGQLRGRPRHPHYVDVVAAVADEVERLAHIAMRAGVTSDALVVDPGLDFGKNTFQSLELVRRLPELVARGRPVLVAASRKDIVGETLAQPPEERLEGSLAVVALAVRDGAAIVRVHDVAPSVRVVRMAEAVIGQSAPVAPVRGLWD